HWPRELRGVERENPADDAGEDVVVARRTHRERHAERQHDHHAEQKDEPRTVPTSAHAAEYTQRVHRESDRKKRRPDPAKHDDERPCGDRADGSEASGRGWYSAHFAPAVQH